MKTLQIGDRWIDEQQGGLARYYYELLRALPATGTDVEGLVVAFAPVSIENITAFAAPNESLWSRWRALRRAAQNCIRRGDIDLLAVHFALYGLPILDKVADLPSVVHFHGPWAGESGAEGAAMIAMKLKAFCEDAVYSRARRLIVLSHAFERELVERYRIPAEHIRVVPGGIDVERFNMNTSREEARRRLGWETNRVIMLTVRRHVKRMGLENLIDAMQAIRSDAVLYLGGAGPITAELRTRIADRGLGNRVKLVGRIADADLPLAYRAADISVVPTQALEGFGLITLESLASGTPVYVTPVGGLPEVLEPFAPNCIFPGTSATEMSRALNEVISGTRPMPAEGACRNYAVEKFSWPGIATQVRGVYQEAMSFGR